LLDQCNDAIEVVDPETLRFLDVNEKACSDLGYSREELLLLGVFDIDPTVDESSRVRINEELRRSGSLLLDSIHRRKDGSTYPVEINMKRVQLDRDYVVAICRDLTKQKEADARLEDSERRYRGVYERSPVGICWVDTRTGQFLRVNAKFCEIVGRTEPDLLGRTFQSITHPHDLEGNLAKMRQMVAGETRHYEMEKRYLRADGSIRWVEVSVVAMWAVQDQPVWHMAIVQDITERKRAEEALRASEARERTKSKELEAVLDAVPVSVFIAHDVACEDITANRAGYEQLRLPKGANVSRNAPPPGQVGFRLMRNGAVVPIGELPMQRAAATGNAEYGVPLSVVFDDGIERYTEFNAVPLLGEDGKPRGVVGASIDLTERKRAEEELRLAKERLGEEKLYLEQAIDSELGFGEIIGRSKTLTAVMESVAKVAGSDATVLLLGETGTGKELVARAIHRMSKRKGNTFIKMNAAAIPAALLESELFGHEKGAFTGAFARKLGRLELADKGTLFLDEIGELPLHLQPKLLRVLQDHEFERLGGTHALRVDFRLVAATNRDLLQSMSEKQFRSDLYYRLNVFPIRVPPLRERREDIRLLAEHFVRKYAGRMGKSITSIPQKAMETLMQWSWPGNVRELENFVERSVILTNGSVLQSPLGELEGRSAVSSVRVKETEREQIVRALRESDGRLAGRNGAAARLGLKDAALQAKLKQLGIDPRRIRG
jgi:PAS domain S-box-containing protein